MRCPDTAKEFSEYEYAVAKDGEVIPGYVDADNHHIDGVRYGYKPHLDTEGCVMGGCVTGSWAQFLPSWAVQTILKENRRLRSQAGLRGNTRTLRAYTESGACPPARHAC